MTNGSLAGRKRRLVLSGLIKGSVKEIKYYPHPYPLPEGEGIKGSSRGKELKEGPKVKQFFVPSHN